MLRSFCATTALLAGARAAHAGVKTAKIPDFKIMSPDISNVAAVFPLHDGLDLLQTSESDACVVALSHPCLADFNGVFEIPAAQDASAAVDIAESFCAACDSFDGVAEAIVAACGSLPEGVTELAVELVSATTGELCADAACAASMWWGVSQNNRDAYCPNLECGFPALTAITNVTLNGALDADAPEFRCQEELLGFQCIADEADSSVYCSNFLSDSNIGGPNADLDGFCGTSCPGHLTVRRQELLETQCFPTDNDANSECGRDLSLNELCTQNENGAYCSAIFNSPDFAGPDVSACPQELFGDGDPSGAGGEVVAPSECSEECVAQLEAFVASAGCCVGLFLELSCLDTNTVLTTYITDTCGVAYDTCEPRELPNSSESPVETNPTPTEPEETNPTPTEPEETDPTPTEPEETNPTPTEPEETNPTPTEPEETNPTPTEPEETDPTPTEPEETNPAPTEPEETNPTPTEPEETNPTPTEPEETTEQTYPTTSAPVVTLPPVDPSCPQMRMDSKNDVFLPPLLDEVNTRVVFHSGSEDMQVRLLIPKQYSTLKVDFEGATNAAAALDVDLLGANPSTAFWRIDSRSDPCNHVATSSIPWTEFRRSLGGINERRYPNSVWYGTQINIETTFAFELKPETLLLAEGDNPHHIQRHTRLVRNVVPFDIHFDLDLTLWAQVNVRSSKLRKGSALLETSVLEVTPDAETVARAELVFVTTIPSPLYLFDSTIAVNDPRLADGLTVSEIMERRDCDDVNVDAFCTQYWRVHVAPQKCDLNGEYTATMFGACNPYSNNCINPSPNTMDIVFNIQSDDYCGVSQQVELEGSLHLKPTRCNEYLKGSIVASSPQGAAIEKIEILKLETTPTLEGQNFLTIFDASKDVEILSFSTSQRSPNQLDFQFEWRGKQLRCDVVAQVDAMVRVEFAATSPLLLSATASLDARSAHVALLNTEDIRMGERILIAADPTQVKETDAPVASAPVAAEGSASTAATASSIVAIGTISTLAALV